MIAGPSEILVIADDSAHPDWVAMDLFSQAEHDELAQAMLLSPDAALLDAVAAAIDAPAARTAAARRSSPQSLAAARRAGAWCATSRKRRDIANRVAPEHLEVVTRDPQALLPLIRHAGAIFLGHYSSEAIGDYCAGPNHVLPTVAHGALFLAARASTTFQKRSSVIDVSAAGAQRSARVAATLARGERLDAHAMQRRTAARRRQRDGR